MQNTTFSVLFVITLIIGLFSVGNAQVIEGDVTLSTQAEINSFSGTSITGNLTIYGSDIVDLTPLSTLESIDGSLWVFGNPALTNLVGLASLAAIGDGLSIEVNNALTHLDGLGNLTTVGDYLTLQDNPLLTDLDG